MSAAVFEREPGSAPAAVLSVLVHVALIAILVFGVSWQSKRPDAVVVELWDRPAVEVKPAPPVEAPKPEPKIEPKPEPKVEAPPPKPDIVVEKKKAPPKKKPEVKKPEPVIKIDRNAAIREQLAQEMKQVTQSAKPAQRAASGPVVDPSYANKIKTKIKGNIVLPPDIVGNPEAIFDVVQLPTGEVLSARLRTSSGNRAYDEAVERAILKSSPLPQPDRPEQFARNLELKFRPQE